ncbi:MAG: hypothetical protein ACE5HE_06470 [Phycisphaerae bacterium]
MHCTLTVSRVGLNRTASRRRQTRTHHASGIGVGAAQLGLAGLQVAGGGLGTGTLGGALGGVLGGLGGTGDLLGGTDGIGQLELLNLQRQINREAQIFTTLTNVEKSHHDARMSAIRNVRP